MKFKWIKKKITYDGSQLKPLYAYENYKVLGNSVISWIGPCQIPFSNMKDLEDVIAKSPIKSDLMLHFIVELFHQSLFAAVSFQRLMTAIICDELNFMLRSRHSKIFLSRHGDDIYFIDKKLSISIATQSTMSSQIHLALNITSDGVPVKALCLNELKVNPKKIAMTIMKKVVAEFNSITEATMKVRS